MGRSYAVCPILPMGLQNIAGSFIFDCPNGKTINSLPQGDVYYYTKGFGAYNLDFLIPFPPSGEPFTAFNYELRWINSTDGNKWSIVENKLAFFFINQYKYSTTPYFFKLRPTIEDISQCRIKINSSSVNNMTIVDRNGNEATGFDTAIPTQAVPGNYCTSDVIVEAQATLLNITSYTKQSRRWAFLMDGLWYSAMFMLSERLENCTNLIEQNLVSSNINTTYPSTSCIYSPQTPEWINDTCCNPIYYWSDQCCQKKNLTTPIQNFQSPTTKFAETCSSPDRTNFLFQDYSTLINLGANPTLGCDASTESYTYDIVNGQFLDLFVCYNNIFGGSQTCQNDTDCPCSRCDPVLGLCDYCPSGPQETAMENCFKNNLPNNIVGQARADWGLTNTDNTTFFNEFFDRVKTSVCLTPIGDTLTTLNETECLELGPCRNATNPLNYKSVVNTSCVIPDFPGTCEICTTLGTCTKLPLGNYCVSTDPLFNQNPSICADYSGGYNQFDNTCYFGFSRSTCQCNTGVDDYPLCNSGYCYDSYASDESLCYHDPSFDSAYKYWDANLGYCVVNIDYINQCSNLGYHWRLGRKWQPIREDLNITNQSDCENLSLCQVGNKLVSGSQCNDSSVTTCSGLCPQCQSTFGSPNSVCLDPNIVDDDTCINATGWWQFDDSICIFLFNESACLANNLIFESCKNMNYSSCEVCQDFDADCSLKSKYTLSCSWVYNNPCNVSMQSGECEQNQYCYNMAPYPGCAYSTSKIDYRSCPICLWDLRNERANETNTNTTNSNSARTHNINFRSRNISFGTKKIEEEENTLDFDSNRGSFSERISEHKYLGLNRKVIEKTPQIYHVMERNTVPFEMEEEFVVHSPRNKRELVNATIIGFNTDYFSIHGCLSNFVTKTSCTQVGAKWIEPLQTKEECLSSKGCRESNGHKTCLYTANQLYSATIDSATNKSQAECVLCGGTYGSLNQWKTSQSIIPIKFNTRWMSQAWSPTNTFVPYINSVSLRNNLERFLFTSASYAISTSVDCETQPIFQTVQYYDCDCTPFANGTKKPSGYCYTNKFVVTAGSQLFCRGDEKTVRIGNAVIGINKESISLGEFCVVMSLGTVSAAQFKSDQKVISSSALLSSLTNKNNPYAIILNTHGFVVGQLLSDGIRLNVSKASTNTNTTSTRATETNNFTLCLDYRSDISNSASDFPLLNFASTTDYKTFQPMNLTGVTFNGKQYCGNVSTTNSIIFPVSLARDWSTRNSIFAGKEKIRNAIYFLSAVMFTLFLCCLVAIIIHFMETRTEFSLTKTCLCLLLIYAGLRATFFLLFALEKLTSISNNNPAGFFVLAELPYYVFLSIFIFLIIFWARLSRSASKDIIKKMIFPVIILNILLYTFFIIIVIIAATVKGDGVTVLNKVYKCIICFIAACIIITSWIFGGLVLKQAIKGWRMRKGDIPTYLIKTTAILFIISFAMLFQVIYLLFITFKSQTSVNLALAVYFLVEVVPACCLFGLFAPIKMERAGLTSRGSSKKQTNTTGSGNKEDNSMKTFNSKDQTPFAEN
eukprot:TRINITY_DN2969_c0_g1_i1.p1 TRINITY_DN2969_c0_g1~~TRINITY_DN2969_c0_g1_i1.p1  ORF type:complete len:1632 (-),score=307.08 TRINITY_DN2969_c0_g1_i1:69-4694(-)